MILIEFYQTSQNRTLLMQTPPENRKKRKKRTVLISFYEVCFNFHVKIGTNWGEITQASLTQEHIFNN